MKYYVIFYIVIDYDDGKVLNRGQVRLQSEKEFTFEEKMGNFLSDSIIVEQFVKNNVFPDKGYPVVTGVLPLSE